MSCSLNDSPALTFDDVSLVPVTGGHDVLSRSEVNINYTKLSLSSPIIVAPMRSVVDVSNIAIFEKFGFTAFLFENGLTDDELKRATHLNLRLSDLQKLVEGPWSRTTLILQKMMNHVWCLDLANGHNSALISQALLYLTVLSAYSDRRLYSLLSNCIVGNVATAAGYSKLASQGFGYVRVGIGGGSACTTRQETGIGVPTLQSIIDISRVKTEDCKVVADGGIRTPGDVVKALAFGADYAMLGGYFAGTTDSPGYDQSTGEVSFYGEASARAKGHSGRVEGAEHRSIATDSLENRSTRLIEGISSGLAYLGVAELDKLSKAHIKAVRLTNNGVKEAAPHWRNS